MSQSEATDGVESVNRPTRVGSLVVLAVTVPLSGALALSLDLGVAFAAAVLAAVPFTVATWLVTRTRWPVFARGVAGVVAFPLGLGVLGGVLYTGITLFGAQFPQPTTAETASATLLVAARLLVVLGVTVAVTGACVNATGLVERSSLFSLWTVVARAALAPAAVAAVLAGSAILGHVEVGSLDATLGTVVTDVVDAATGVMLSPAGDSPALLTLGVLVLVAAALANHAMAVLPVVAVLGPDTESEVAALRRGLGWTAWVGLLLAVPGMVVDYLVPERVLREELGEGYGVLVDVTTVESVRTALVAVAAVSLALAFLAATVKRLANTSASAAVRRYAPTAGGATVVAGSTLVHGDVVWRVQSFVASNVPRTLDSQYQELSQSVIAYYGTLAIAATALTVVFLAALAAVTALHLGVVTRVVPEASVGPTLAAGGLFLAAAFVGTTDVAPTLFLAAVLGSFVAWDAGEFARTLGAEIGRRADTRTAEAVHVTASVLVGAVGAAAAAATLQTATQFTFVDPTGLPAALVGVSGALFLLVVAIR